MKKNTNGKIRLTLTGAICMAFIVTAFSGAAVAADSEHLLLIEPIWADRYNLVGFHLSDGTAGYDFDDGVDFLPFEAQTVAGPQDAIEADQYSYIFKSSISALGTADLQTEPFPPDVEWAQADSGSLFYVVFRIEKSVRFSVVGQISARASSNMGYIESRAAVRLALDGSSEYILDHYIELNSGEKMIPFAIKGVLKPGIYYISAFATGYYDIPRKDFSSMTGAKSGYWIDLSVLPIMNFYTCSMK